MTQSEYTQLFSEDLVDAVKLCNAALAQDAPEMPKTYIVQIMNMLFAYLSPNQRKEIETYLAEKEYLPPLKLIRPNEVSSTVAASDLLNGL